jgi:hypothetical protein
MARARTQTLKAAPARQVIELDMSRATAGVINAALQQDVVKAVLGAYIEGRGLEGSWQLQITGARLVPVES